MSLRVSDNRGGHIFDEIVYFVQINNLYNNQTQNTNLKLISKHWSLCNGIATGRYINEAAVRCLSTPAAQGP